jgi:hypothetical protein
MQCEETKKPGSDIVETGPFVARWISGRYSPDSAGSGDPDELVAARLDSPPTAI